MQNGSPNSAGPPQLRIDLGTGGSGPDWVDLELRRSRRARRAGIRVRPGVSPEVVLPVGAPLREIESLLENHRDWLRSKLRWARSLEEEARRLGLLSSHVVWLEGRPLPLAELDWPSARAKGPTDGTGLANGPGAAELERWYRDKAQVRLGEATARLAADLAGAGLIGRPPGRITIRDPRSRWGSCSARGNLSYSWRLVMMPRQALEYVVCHELCHLAVHDHSSRFWQLIERARPGWRQEATWLRRYGPLISLHRPGGFPGAGVTANHEDSGVGFGALPGVDQLPPRSGLGI